MTSTLPTVYEIAKSIDHALLKPDLDQEEFYNGVQLAKKYDVYSVCVRPSDIEQAMALLAGTDVRVGTVVGFPHGSATTSSKVFETVDALSRGAVEIDFVVNIANVKRQQLAPVLQEMREIANAAKEHGAQKTKAIFETAYLEPVEVRLLAQMAHTAGVDFVKTSTGFASAGATLENLQIMRDNALSPTEVKASGGVRDLDTLLTMRNIGVTRFGTSATQVILDDLAQRLDGGPASGQQGVAGY